jgi:tetratricopeptide (TPR) repeat protein
MTVSPLAAAIALHQRNPLEEVARAYHDILADDPWQADARPILLQQGKIAAAQNQFETALRSLPDYALARNNLANCWPVLGDAPRAIILIRHALALDPNSARTQAFLAGALEEHENLAEAALHYEQAPGPLFARLSACETN